MLDLDRWEKLSRLGEGGQGAVFLVRHPDRVSARAQAKGPIASCVRSIGGHSGESSDSIVQRLLNAIADYNRPDVPSELGALKVFKISSDDREEESRAIGRLQSEIEALRKIDHPAVLKLVHANVAERFLVTEYHPLGALSKHLGRYRGRPLEALVAFKPLVEAVAGIHYRQGAIHRDIKTDNIFVATDGRLVLGDFGIVFLAEGQRQTTTFERVGSHYWMPPWAYKNERLSLDDVNPTLDIFPLCKVLWSMIAGRNGFAFWEWQRNDNNLEAMFPNDTLVPLINNRIMAACVVRDDADCQIRSGYRLLDEVDTLIKQGSMLGERVDGAPSWPCRVCCMGAYCETPAVLIAVNPSSSNAPVYFQIYVCDHCGHAESFHNRPETLNLERRRSN